MGGRNQNKSTGAPFPIQLAGGRAYALRSSCEDQDEIVTSPPKNPTLTPASPFNFIAAESLVKSPLHRADEYACQRHSSCQFVDNSTQVVIEQVSYRERVVLQAEYECSKQYNHLLEYLSCPMHPLSPVGGQHHVVYLFSD